MAIALPTGPDDPLGRALHHLRMSGAFYGDSLLTAPWGLTMPELPGYMWFHIVTSGGFELDAPGEETVRLGRGDLVLVTGGAGHVLRSEPAARAPGILEIERDIVSERYEIVRHGGGGEPTRLICGAVQFDHPAARNLVRALPETITIRAEASADVERIQATLGMIAIELASPRPGGEAVIMRLADVMVIQAIRAWIEHGEGARTGWFGAMRDEHVGRALALVHEDPSREWSVAALATECAMSRSAFAARFSSLVGEPAMAYVTRLRMELASTALREEGATVAELANRLGYRSEAAFARAFKREVGVAPGRLKGVAIEDPIAALL